MLVSVGGSMCINLVITHVYQNCKKVVNYLISKCLNMMVTFSSPCTLNYISIGIFHIPKILVFVNKLRYKEFPKYVFNPVIGLF